MKYYELLIYILTTLSNSKFVLSKDNIGSDGIPSHWKRYHERVNNPNYHNSRHLSNKILDNYETSFQDVSKIIPPKVLPSYKITQPTLNNLLYKNLLSHFNVDVRNSPSSDYNKASGRQNDESNMAGNTIEQYEEDERRATEQIPEETNKNPNIENTFKQSDKAKVRQGTSEQKTMNIVHHHPKIPFRHVRYMDSSSFPETSEFRNENLEKESEVEESQKSKQITRRSESEKSENLQKDNNENEELPRNADVEEKEEIDDNGRRTGNIGLIRPMYLHPFNDPRGWIRYRFMPNQFALSNGNYIKRLYPYTKDSSPLHKQRLI